MKKHYGLEKLEDLAEKMEDWTNAKGFVKDGRLYYNSSYNPSSEWDWYRIGGRWNGEIIGKPRSDETGFNFPNEFESPHENIAKVKDANLSCFAFVTPEGEWIEQAEMHWFGVTSNDKEKEEWERILAEIAKEYADHWIVGVDCHI